MGGNAKDIYTKLPRYPSLFRVYVNDVDGGGDDASYDFFMVTVVRYAIRCARPQVNISEECRETILATDVTAYDIFDSARAEVLAVMEVRVTGRKPCAASNMCCVYYYILRVDQVHQAAKGTR